MSPPVGGGGPGKFSYFRFQMAHSETVLCFFFVISFTIEGIKVLGEQILEKICVALSDDSIVL